MTMPSLLDVATFQGTQRDLIDEVLKQVPEMGIMPWTTITGQQYRTVVRTADPTVAFRDANNGPTATKSTFENRLVECFLLNPRWQCDKAVADIHPRGAAYYIGIEAFAMLRAAFKTLAAQIYYGTGTGGDSKGFPGFLAAYDSTNMVVDAGGTTDSIASSVWMVRRGEQDVQMVLGNQGAITMDDVRLGDVAGSNSALLTAYIQECLAWSGMQVGNKWSIGRIQKITTDSGKTLTDAMLSDLFDKFPVGNEPDVIFMNRRSRGQLRKSRTATNPTGAPAPYPQDWEGIPIVVTDAILNTELLAS